MKKADQHIIDANPGASPHDLLLLPKPISQQGFEELVASMDIQMEKAQTFKVPVLTPNIPKNVLQPQLPILSSPGHIPSGKVRIIPPGGGLGTVMNKKDAEALARRNPKYKISYNG